MNGERLSRYKIGGEVLVFGGEGGGETGSGWFLNPLSEPRHGKVQSAEY